MEDSYNGAYPVEGQIKEKHMLRMKNLLNRVYDGKRCVRFEVQIPVSDNHFQLATFENVPNVVGDHDGSNEWQMRVIMDRDRDKDSDVYKFRYVMPKSGLPLELIAATGLKYFQLYLKNEVQQKSNMDFVIGTMLEGM